MDPSIISLPPRTSDNSLRHKTIGLCNVIPQVTFLLGISLWNRRYFPRVFYPISDVIDFELLILSVQLVIQLDFYLYNQIYLRGHAGLGELGTNRCSLTSRFSWL